MLEVDPNVLMMTRLSMSVIFGAYTYFVFAPPLKAAYARLRARRRR
ncbi:MAG: hypothetical protein AB7M12_06525 [Hyphomonadaceae bacterium]